MSPRRPKLVPWLTADLVASDLEQLADTIATESGDGHPAVMMLRKDAQLLRQVSLDLRPATNQLELGRRSYELPLADVAQLVLERVVRAELAATKRERARRRAGGSR